MKKLSIILALAFVSLAGMGQIVRPLRSTYNGTVITGQYGGTGTANTGKTVTIGGSFVTSGAYPLTFILTDSTEVTLPTSGTLSTGSGGGIPIGIDNYILDADNGVVVGGEADSVKANYGFIGGGQYNFIDSIAEYSVVVGGSNNIVLEEAQSAFIGGGNYNEIGVYGYYASIVGGDQNSIGYDGEYSFIGGGGTNRIGQKSYYSFIGGGYTNTIGYNADFSFIGGGAGNVIDSLAEYAIIIGGEADSVKASYGFIGGGYQNRVDSIYGIVLGGRGNIASNYGAMVLGGGFDAEWDDENGEVVIEDYPNVSYGALSVIVGGYGNTIGFEADYSIIVGGEENTIDSLANNSFIGGGEGNVIDSLSEYAVIVGGEENSIGYEAYYSFIGGGEGNVIDSLSQYAVIVGGVENSIGYEAYYSFIGGGYANKIDSLAQYASIIGGYGAIADKTGQTTTNSNSFSGESDGSAQSSIIQVSDTVLHDANVWHNLYTNGTESDDGAEYCTISANSVWTFTVRVVGTTEASAKAWSYTIQGAIKRDASNNTTLLGSTVSVVYEADSDFDCQVIADDTNESLNVQVKDATYGGDIVRWVATIETTEVRFPAGT